MSRPRVRIHGVGPMDLARTAAAFAMAVVVEVGLRSLDLPRLSRLLGVPLDTAPAREAHADDLVVVPHWAFGDSCLRVALVGGFLVRDLAPILRIGVARHHGEVKAHAWLEIGGRSLDPGSVDFLPVERIRS